MRKLTFFSPASLVEVLFLDSTTKDISELYGTMRVGRCIKKQNLPLLPLCSHPLFSSGNGYYMMMKKKRRERRKEKTHTNKKHCTL